MADTDYIWMMDDDDIIAEGTIKAILEKLYDNPDFLILNSSKCDSEMNVQKEKIIKCQ